MTHIGRTHRVLTNRASISTPITKASFQKIVQKLTDKPRLVAVTAQWCEGKKLIKQGGRPVRDPSIEVLKVRSKSAESKLSKSSSDQSSPKTLSLSTILTMTVRILISKINKGLQSSKGQQGVLKWLRSLNFQTMMMKILHPIQVDKEARLILVKTATRSSSEIWVSQTWTIWTLMPKVLLSRIKRTIDSSKITKIMMSRTRERRWVTRGSRCQTTPSSNYSTSWMRMQAMQQQWPTQHRLKKKVRVTEKAATIGMVSWDLAQLINRMSYRASNI